MRKASISELVRFNLNFTNSFISKGVTTIECKTGYGLDEENELKQLEVLNVLKKISPIEIVATFMGAHAVPENSNPQDYVEYLNEDVRSI